MQYSHSDGSPPHLLLADASGTVRLATQGRGVVGAVSVPAPLRTRRCDIKPSCRRVLSALITADVNGLTAVQLAHPTIAGLDYRKRVSELRKVGYLIDSRSIPGKPYNRYVLYGRAYE